MDRSRLYSQYPKPDIKSMNSSRFLDIIRSLSHHPKARSSFCYWRTVVPLGVVQTSWKSLLMRLRWVMKLRMKEETYYG